MYAWGILWPICNLILTPGPITFNYIWMDIGNISILAAFTAGVLSFFSPCILPLIPAYISFISGVSLEDLRKVRQDKSSTQGVVLNSVFFVIGFSTVFTLLGASATFIGQYLQSNMNVLTKVAGVIIILFGIHTMGIFRIRFLDYEKRMHLRSKKFGVIGSSLVGIAFALGWTPCIGPILGAILAYASTEQTLAQGISLLVSYSFGLGIPFVLAALSIEFFFKMFNKIRSYFRVIEVASGIVLILMGIIIFTNKFNLL